MKNKILTAIANSPIYVAIGLKYLSERLIQFSFKVHITFDTETGRKIAMAEQALRKMAEAYKNAQAGMQSDGSEESKLASVIGNMQQNEPQPEGVIDLAKKRAESKD